MLLFILEIVAATSLMQAPPANPACAVLTPAQVSGLVGAANALPMAASATGATCMFQNQDRIITVLMASPATADAAKGLFDSKKRIVAGADVPGWGVPAYSGVMKDTAIVGVLVKQTLTEVKVIDPTHAAEANAVKLQAVMKEVAARK